MNYALLALTATQIVIIAVCAFVGVALIATAAIAGIARSMKEKKHPAAPAAQEPAEQPAQPAEQTPEEEAVPEGVKAEEVPVVEEPEEELPAPEEVKAEEVPVVEEPEEELPAPEEVKAEEVPSVEEPEEVLPAPEEVKAEEVPVVEEPEEVLPAPEEAKAEEVPVVEQPEEVLPAPEEVKAEEVPVVEEPEEELPAPEEVKAEEVPVVEEPEEELPTPEEVKAEEVPVVETPEEAQAPADGTTRVIYTNDDGWYVNVRYDKSFEAKLIQGDEKLKNYYSELKNELLSYKKVTARKSWQHEAFRRGRTTVAKLVIRGKTLRLYLALEPMLYEESKYLVEDASEHAKFAKTPLLYRIKNDRRCRYAKDLIAAAMASAEALRGDDQNEDYASVPYESTDDLIAQGLVRIIEVRRRKDGAGGIVPPADEEYEEDEEDEEPLAPEEEEPAEPVALAPRPVTALTVQGVQEEHRVSVSAADTLMADEEAEGLVSEAERVSDKRRQTIVNIDTLSEYFSDGERVGIEEMKERIPFFNKKATYVKVLARGVLTKTLEVEADDFSLDAVKMIALLGGKIYRTRK